MTEAPNVGNSSMSLSSSGSRTMTPKCSGGSSRRNGSCGGGRRDSDTRSCGFGLGYGGGGGSSSSRRGGADNQTAGHGIQANHRLSTSSTRLHQQQQKSLQQPSMLPQPIVPASQSRSQVDGGSYVGHSSSGSTSKHRQSQRAEGGHHHHALRGAEMFGGSSVKLSSPPTPTPPPPPPPPPPQRMSLPPPPAEPSQQFPGGGGGGSGCGSAYSDRTFMKYLGLDGECGTPSPHDHRRRSLRSSGGLATAREEHHQMPPLMQQPQPQQPYHYPHVVQTQGSNFYQYGDQYDYDQQQRLTAGHKDEPEAEEEEEFAEEECFYNLVGLMLLHARAARPDAEGRIGAMRAYAAEFGEWVRKFCARNRVAFPFYQPEMLVVHDLLTAASSQVDGNQSGALRIMTEHLRSIHLNMQLFLRPDLAISETVGDLDEATVARLIMDYADQVNRDLLATYAGASAMTDEATSYKDNADASDGDEARHGRRRYARRRAVALTAAVGRYARTAEHRRRLIVERMRGLAELAAVAATSTLANSSGGCGDGGSDYGEAVAGLYSCMVSGFDCCFPDATAGDAADGATASETTADASGAVAAFDAAAAADAEVASTAAGSGDNDYAAADCATASANTASAAAVAAAPEYQESAALQLMERLEGLIVASFLPNERVNALDFKSAFDELNRWWQQVAATAARGGGRCLLDKRAVAKLASIRDGYQKALGRRADASGVKRICTEAETAWDLIEVAKLMVAAPGAEDRTMAVLGSRTTADWRDATLRVVSSILARLYLYQVSQDPSAVSMRLRADLQRLVARLADQGTGGQQLGAPLLALLRLRLCYLRARQFSDLLRALPQGCLILELMQVHRVLRGNTDGMALTLSAPLCDYNKFYQHFSSRDLRVQSFEARAPATDKNSMLSKTSCLKKVEMCCQCTIEPMPAAAASGRPRQVTLQVRPDSSHGRANAAMRMLSDIGEAVRYRDFRLELEMPANYRPLTVFVETSRPID